MSDSRPGSPPPPRLRAFDVPVVAAVGALAVLVVASALRMAPDDGFIVWRYVRNIAGGHGWVYNLGESVNACTSPLHALSLAGLCAVLPISPTAANAITSALALATAGTCVHKALRGLGCGRALPALSAVLVVLVPLHRTTLGLESHLQTACAMAFWLAWLRNAHVAVGVAGGLAVLARPDAVLLVLPACAASLLRRSMPRAGRVHAALRCAGAALCVLVPWLAWSAWQFGELLPNTLAAKMAQGASGLWDSDRFVRELQRSLRTFDSFGIVGSYKPWLVVLALGAAASACGVATWPFFVATALHAAAYAWLDVPFFHWYALPSHLAVALTPAALALLARRRPRLRALHGVAIALAALLLAAAANVRFPSERALGYERIGRWIAEHAPESASLACYEIGQVGLAAYPRRVVDLAGLVTPEAIPHLRAHEFAWVLDQRPDFLVLHEPPWQHLETAITADPRFAAGYHRVPGAFGDGLALWRRE